jgi:rubrerythrin
MQLTTRIPKRRSSRRTKPEQPALTREAAETRDARRGGGPQDRALYSCMCGYAFEAKVTTSVSCPHCGTEQAW